MCGLDKILFENLNFYFLKLFKLEQKLYKK